MITAEYTHKLGAPESKLQRRLKRVLSGDFSRIPYLIRNKLRGIDLGPATAEQYGLDSSRVCHHSNSGGPDLEAMLRILDIPKGSRIIDFGCGKGGPLFSFAKFPFTEVVGIEIAPEMAEIARVNGSKLRCPAKIITGDASQLRDLDRFTHFYFFNPSAVPVMREIFQNIINSLDRTPREVTLLCMYADEDAVHRFVPQSSRLRFERKIEHGMSQPLFVFRAQ